MKTQADNNIQVASESADRTLYSNWEQACINPLSTLLNWGSSWLSFLGNPVQLNAEGLPLNQQRYHVELANRESQRADIIIMLNNQSAEMKKVSERYQQLFSQTIQPNAVTPFMLSTQMNFFRQKTSISAHYNQNYLDTSVLKKIHQNIQQNQEHMKNTNALFSEKILNKEQVSEQDDIQSEISFRITEKQEFTQVAQAITEEVERYPHCPEGNCTPAEQEKYLASWDEHHQRVKQLVERYLQLADQMVSALIKSIEQQQAQETIDSFNPANN
ncbi:MAG: hypothetical protein Tsb005_07740 [Gammaproteobacteria bacterium]